MIAQHKRTPHISNKKTLKMIASGNTRGEQMLKYNLMFGLTYVYTHCLKWRVASVFIRWKPVI